MNIICVDDEELVLGLTVSLCRELKQKPDVVSFGSASEALRYLKRHPADICLLDISMPDMDGLMLAAKVKELQPDCAIIFLTGFSEYAVDAFELHASGYLLKPVNRERLQAEVDHALAGKAEAVKSDHIKVRTFGEFDLIVDGHTVAFPRSRAKELLAYLVDRQGRSVTRANAFAILYEDTPYDRPMQKQFDVIVRSLKETLAVNDISEIFELNKGTMRVVPETFDCDLYRFYKGDAEAVNAYHGEYMSAYSWASMTEAYVDRRGRPDLLDK